MSELAKKGIGNPNNALMQERLDFLAKQRLEIERMLIREDPQLFLGSDAAVEFNEVDQVRANDQFLMRGGGAIANPHKEKAYEISKGKHMEFTQGLRYRDWQGQGEVAHQQKAYSLYELTLKEKQKTLELKSFKDRIRRPLYPPLLEQATRNNPYHAQTEHRYDKEAGLMLLFDFVLCDRPDILQDAFLIYGLYNLSRPIVKPKMVNLSARNVYQIADQLCAVVEESHLHTLIEANSDISVILEYQLKESSGRVESRGASRSQFDTEKQNRA